MSTKEIVRNSMQAPPPAIRHRLPNNRDAVTRRLQIGSVHVFVIVGLYPCGTPGEVFIHGGDSLGTTIHGLLDVWAITFSMALQFGVPMRDVCHKLAHSRFDPQGPTGEEELGIASSVIDAVVRWMLQRFCNEIVEPEPMVEQQPYTVIKEFSADVMPGIPGSTPGKLNSTDKPIGFVVDDGRRIDPRTVLPTISEQLVQQEYWAANSDAPTCRICGTLMMPNGKCHKCPNCGHTDGCS